MASTLVLIRDLMFGSKVRAAARAVGVEIEFAGSPAALAGKIADRLIVDLNQSGNLDAAIAWKGASADRRVIGFASHVDIDTLNRARAAGIEQVMSNGQFSASIDSILKG
jgi:hypothetical protein